ncbi:aminotransferase class V-fold PLP-dependent enzyme [Kiloniella sp. b19]|uniref:aminotransferase class V-fold PLP-dependent enzyme n=1 Tax=Kiloniella sp. GXU_MW_B19 TaxID=3141326 RepID=UPI0031DC3985
MTALDLSFVRQHFPAFEEAEKTGRIYFENAGGSYVCAPVMERWNSFCRECKGQPAYPNAASRQASVMMEEAYSSMARWLNVPADEIYLGPSTSQNSYVLAHATEDWLQAGDEIIVTNQDHEGNSGVWRKLEKRGIVVREWTVDPVTGRLNPVDLPGLMTEKTRLLTFPHVSNILGEINPVREICDLARSRGVRTITDGVAFAGHGLPDVQELGCDIYLFSLYKVFGPHLGLMVIRRDMAEKLSSQGHYFNADVRDKRLMPAGPDHAQVAAVKGMSDYFDALYDHHFGEGTQVSDRERAAAVRKLLSETEAALMEELLGYLSACPALQVVGPDSHEGRAPTISVVPTNGMTPVEINAKLGERGLLCGSGHFYSLRLVEALGHNGTTGVLRFSLAHYTSREDIRKLIAALDEVLG